MSDILSFLFLVVTQYYVWQYFIFHSMLQIMFWKSWKTIVYIIVFII